MEERETQVDENPKDNHESNENYHLETSLDSEVGCKEDVVVDAARVTPPTTTNPQRMSLELPNEVEGEPNWVYTVQEHSYARMVSPAPWVAMSPEADFEKHLQLLPASELITLIARYLVTLRWSSADPEAVQDKVSGSRIESWQVATMINRLEVYTPNWKDQVVQAYVLREREYAIEKTSRSRAKQELPPPLPAEVVPARLRQIEQLIDTATENGEVTFFARRVILAWRQVADTKIKMRARLERQRTALRDGPRIRPNKPSLPSPTKELKGMPAGLPALASLTPAAAEELTQIVAVVNERDPTASLDVEQSNDKLFDRIKAEARRIANQKGSTVVNFRDIRQSAEAMDEGFRKKATPSPSEEQPKHIDEVVESLSALYAETLRLSRGGKAPPRVLVVGETGSNESPPVVAKMFRDAGAEVVTCDLKESSYEGIPHYCGDAVNIQDQGWDLVICHPPCTYLSNAGVMWLKKDPIRWQQLRQNASVFRMLYAAQAPFVVAENAKMHLHGRHLIGGIGPSQYVHPWQHGHGHTKPTGLFLKNLPLLVPSNEVDGRENALANVTPSPKRAEMRSRTYAGIAAAMAIQWMPTLHQHCQTPTSIRNGLTAEQMLAKARETPIHRAHVIFIRKTGIGEYEANTRGGSTPMNEIAEGEAPAVAVTELAQECLTPQRWMEALQTELEVYPAGHRCYYHTQTPDSRFCNHRPSVTRAWVVDVSEILETDGETALEWTPLKCLRTPWPSEPTQSPLALRYQKDIEAIARASRELTEPQVLAVASSDELNPEPTSRQPWLVDYEDLPPPPPTPRHIRRRHGKWQVWNVINPTPTSTVKVEPDEAELERDEPHTKTSEVMDVATRMAMAKSRPVPRYGWQHLPPSITDSLNAHLGLPFKPMKAMVEETRSEVPSRPTKKVTKAAVVGALTRQEGPQQATFWRCQDVQALWNVDWSKTPAEWMKARGGMDCPPLTERSKLLWSRRPPRKTDLETPGLGASLRNHSREREPYPTESKKACFEFIRNEHRRFVSHGVLMSLLDGPEKKGTDVAVMDSPEGPEAPAPCNKEADANYSEWLDDCSNHRKGTPTIAAMVRSTSSDSIMEQDVALTPNIKDYAATSLYVTDFQVFRRAQTRKGEDESYTVDTAVAGRVLADTGAAPSIVTTELLEKLPRDCRISRDPRAAVGPLNGADGNPLVTQGKVKIDFCLGGQPCQHEFTVVQGKPLVLLGNDFLVPRNAKINLNTDGEGNGSITLISPTRQGNQIHHGFNVSSRARPPDRLGPIRPTAERGVALVDLAPTKSSPKIGTGTSDASVRRWVPEPQKPNNLTIEAFKEEGWKLETSEHLLYTHEAVEIPPQSRISIRVRAPQQLLEQKGVPSCLVDRLRQVDSEGNLETRHVPPVVTRLTTIQDGYVEIELVNVSKKKKSIAGLSPLAMLDSEYYVKWNLDPTKMVPGQESPDPLDQLTEAQTKLLDQVTIDPANRLSDEKKTQVRRLLAENISAFATDPKNPTKTHLLEVELPLKPNVAPHRHAASRVGEEGRQIIEKHVEEMESRGIIRKSNSAWGSRVVLVTKKDGSIRFCVDYRDLNAKLQLQDSPIPLTVEALDRLSSGKGCPSSLFLSTLDLAAGFWTLPVKESDKGLTAFVTHRQKYEFNYLPFGIQSGPSYMVRLMDAALQGLAWETCMPYLDDVGVWSTGMGDNLQEREDASFEQMMTRLRAVFERLRWAGLSMKASKCILFGIEAEYLGHVVSREGLKMDPKKIEVVKNWDITDMSTVTKVRSFLGMCSYYRRFIEGFSRVAAPLTDLTKNGVDVEKEAQTPECKRAMQILVKAITSEPVMSTPRFDREFLVKTDAANKEGLGGVLSQVNDEGREKVVAYHGRRLNKHERNYTVTEIELLAAVDSIKHWRPYLWGRAFKLIVDHSALRWLHTMRDTMEGGPASRLMRWILKLSEYRFHVEHKPGSLHKDADGVSRLVAVASRQKSSTTITARSRQAAARTTQTTAEVQLSYLDTGAPPLKQLRTEQANDPECAEIMDYLSGDLDDVADDRDLKRLAKLVRMTSSGTHNQKRAVHVPRGCDEDNMKVIKRMAVHDGVLYRSLHIERDSSDEENVSPNDGDQWVPFVPIKMRSALIAAFHERMGHASRDRVQGALQKRFFWPKMRQDIEDHVSECHECTLAKYPTTRNRDPVGPAVGRYPFDILYTDVLDLANTHDYTPEGAGYRKLVVFADSLSRWVEAVPTHGEPTAAEFMDLYHEHIVARYGVPRAIVSDRGSNLVAALNAEILKQTGTDMRASAAEHHEANGVVERFNQTLQNMARASNEGGANWKDHLPFLLMAYRATPHRVTRESPAMILFGRELRLPAQVGQPEPPPSTLLHDGTTKDVREYATRLHNRMVYAWRAAYEASREAQGGQVSDTTAHALRGHRIYQVNDRVARRLYGAANAMAHKYSGPYRIAKVLGHGRYRLSDLENQIIYDEFDASNLRPYRTHTDEEELSSDEYLVESLLNRRVVRGQVSYLVKYFGYAKNLAQWTPREELERRCDDLLEEYDAKQPKRKSPPKARKALVPLGPSQTALVPERAPMEPVDSPESHLPDQARLGMGGWSYGRKVKSRRSKDMKVVWKDASHFTTEELDSEKFKLLRDQARADAEDDADIAAVFSQTDAYESAYPEAGLFRESGPTPVREEVVNEYASQVWFVTNDDAMCFHRVNDDPAMPRLDTYGGRMEPHSKESYADYAVRKLEEQVTLPGSWIAALRRAVALDPEGQACVKLRSDEPGERPRTAIWFVRLTDPEATDGQPSLTQSGGTEVRSDTMMWRAHGVVLSNLSSFDMKLNPLIAVMKTQLIPLSSREPR